MILHTKNLCTLDGVIEGYVHIADEKIVNITTECTQDYLEYGDAYILPGYIDLHIHGWATGSFWMEKTPASIREMITYLPRCGVTSFLATTGADSMEETMRYIEAGNQVYKQQPQGAQLLGLHMEGPFINKAYKGMQKEEHCFMPDVSIMKQFYQAQEDKHMIKLMSLAPELEGAKELIQFCHEHQIQCSIGHSGASFDCIKELKAYGLGGVTHMFSGMKSFHHRDLSVVGAALYFDDLYCEFAKQSGMTVKHEAFDFVYRLKTVDKVYLTTDCEGMAKAKEPFYHYIRKERFEPENGMLKITKDSGEVTYKNPSIYDEVKDIEISYAKSVQNMMAHTNMDMVSLSKITSLNPAKYIGVDDKKGSIAVGKDADLVILDATYGVLATYCKGQLMK